MKAEDARHWGIALGLAAAPRTVAEIAGYTGPDRQAILEAGAK